MKGEITDNTTTWLWQTCRLIANTTRLNLLQEIDKDPEQCVSALATQVERTPAAVSTQLRMLCDAGLTADRRQGQQVFYQLRNDKEYPYILKINKALRESFSDDIPYSYMMRQATACTHWRRIELLRLLARQPMLIDEMEKKTVMAAPALLRHMSKLESRNYVVAQGKQFSLGYPSGHIAKALLQIINTP